MEIKTDKQDQRDRPRKDPHVRLMREKERKSDYCEATEYSGARGAREEMDEKRARDARSVK